MIILNFLRNRTNLDLFCQGQPLQASVGSYYAEGHAPVFAKSSPGVSIASQVLVAVLSFLILFSAIHGEDEKNGSSSRQSHHFLSKI